MRSFKDLVNEPNRSFKDARCLEGVVAASERSGEAGVDEVGGREVDVISAALKGVVSRSEPAGEVRVGQVEWEEWLPPEIMFFFIVEFSFGKNGEYQILMRKNSI